MISYLVYCATGQSKYERLEDSNNIIWRKELKRLILQPETKCGGQKYRNRAFVMVFHVARPSYLLSNFHQPLVIGSIHQHHQKASSRLFSYPCQSQPHCFLRGSSILPIKVAHRWERQSFIPPIKDPVAHLHLKMSAAAKPSESSSSLPNLSEFLLAQKSGYLRAVGEGTHKDVWTISMGNEAGGQF